jgi:hypothetical protein
MSTLLSDLESAPVNGDGDFVQNILNEMNNTQPPPAVGGVNHGVINAPNPNTLSPMTMDSGPITAHMIGASHPTPADFNQMMNTHQPMGSAYAPQAPQAVRAPTAPPKRSWISRAADEFRMSFFVAILVFVFSLPIVNFLFAHYIPWMVKSTGELTWIGLLAKSFVAGISFWVLQRVVVPLLSL